MPAGYYGASHRSVPGGPHATFCRVRLVTHAFLFADYLAGLPPAVIDVPVGVPRQIKKAKYRGYP